MEFVDDYCRFLKIYARKGTIFVKKILSFDKKTNAKMKLFSICKINSGKNAKAFHTAKKTREALKIFVKYC